MKTIVGALGLVTAISIGRAAHAQSANEVDAESQSLQERAETQLANGQYDQALLLFQRAYALTPSRRGLLGLARAEADAGRLLVARNHYKEFLSTEDDDARSDTESEAVQRAIDEIARRIGHITFVPETKSGITLELDGAPIPNGTKGGGVEVEPGAHVLFERLDGCDPVYARFTVADGSRTQFPIDLGECKRALSSGPSVRLGDSKTDENGSRRAGWIALGTGGALLVVSTVSLMVALDGSNNHGAGCTGPCPPDTARSEPRADAQTWWTLSGVGFAAGALAAGTGALLLLSTPSRHVTPYVALGGVGAVGTF